MSKRRRKRLFPKYMSASYIHTGRIDHSKAAAYNEQRSKATEGPRSNSLHKLNNSFTQELPETKRPRVWNPKKKAWVYQPTERTITLEKKHELLVLEGKDLFGLYRVWQTQRNQGVSEYHCMILKKIGTEFKLMLFFSGNEFLFVQEYQTTRMISRTYTGRDVAMWHKNNNKISWIVTEAIKT